MNWKTTKENKDLFQFLEKNKENQKEALQKAVEKGEYSKDLYLIERDDDSTLDDGTYFGMYLLDEFAENDKYHELLAYILSIYETTPTKKQWERALQMAVVHGAKKNTLLLIEKGAVPNKETISSAVLEGRLGIYTVLEEKFLSLIQKNKSYLLKKANWSIENELSDSPKKTKIIMEKIKKINEKAGK